MPVSKLTPAEVRAAADRLPRVRLAHLPTPLEELPRFAAELGSGVRVFVKRDDCTGLVLGGNKARHNEFLFGTARQFGSHGAGHERIGEFKVLRILVEHRGTDRTAGMGPTRFAVETASPP